MKNKLVLSNYIPESRFLDICNFVEEIYMMEYDMLILMARKFFNLFCVFHEENCRKYECLGIPYQHEGKIITNRALPLIKDDIKNHKYKKIVIADDIIIHGRTIKTVYDELISLCPELDVLLMSYARNDHDTTVYGDILDRMNSRHLIEVCERRELSEEIVNTFYMSGRPYISYLPYFILDVDWEKLKKEFLDKDCLSIQNGDMKRFGIEAYMYTGKETKAFSCLKCCESSVIRFYYYSQLNRVVMIPYFCMHILKNESLIELSDHIRKLMFESEYRSLLDKNHNADEMRVMELEYTISTWAGMYFLDKCNCRNYRWDKTMEDYNFSERLLSEARYSCKEIEKFIEDLREIDNDILIEEMEPENQNEEIKMLLEKYEGLKKKYTENLERWKALKWWKEDCLSYEQCFIDEYLATNGMLDEERSRKVNSDRGRLFGVPLSYILDDMSEFLYELFDHSERKEEYIKKVFAAVIASADSGKGTIVTKTKWLGDSHKCNESVVYAGEQNYKYYENTNFPIMYALYLTERESERRDQKDKIVHRKAELAEKMIGYLEAEQIFYIKEEILQISDFNLSESYKKYLQNSYEKYSGNHVLQMAVSMAMDICNND